MVTNLVEHVTISDLENLFKVCGVLLSVAIDRGSDGNFLVLSYVTKGFSHNYIR